MKIVVLLFFVFGITISQAQQTTDAAGGDAIGVGGKVSFSIGQIDYSTNTGLNGSVAQGVQQPYEISIFTEVKEAKDISLSFVVYPNPTSDFLKLKVENYSSQNLTYTFSTFNGKIIETKKMDAYEVSITMEQLATGTYFLKVAEFNKDLKIFKIIKN